MPQSIIVTARGEGSATHFLCDMRWLLISLHPMIRIYFSHGSLVVTLFIMVLRFVSKKKSFLLEAIYPGGILSVHQLPADCTPIPRSGCIHSCINAFINTTKVPSNRHLMMKANDREHQHYELNRDAHGQQRQKTSQ